MKKRYERCPNWIKATAFLLNQVTESEFVFLQVKYFHLKIQYRVYNVPLKHKQVSPDIIHFTWYAVCHCCICMWMVKSTKYYKVLEECADWEGTM